MSEGNVAKVTINLPPNLLDLANRLAQEQSTTRSRIIAGLLEKEGDARIRALMAQGYQMMGEENLREAQEALNLTREVVLGDG